jgi:hypothetical protein
LHTYLTTEEIKNTERVRAEIGEKTKITNRKEEKKGLEGILVFFIGCGYTPFCR